MIKRKKPPPALLNKWIGLVVTSNSGLLMSSEKHARKQADTHELQQIRGLSQFRDGFTEETLEKLHRKIS